MLQCTPAAASTLRGVKEQQGVPDTFALRIYPAQTGEGEVTLGLGFTEHAEEGDEVTEEHGTRMFVSGDIADQLSGMALDVVPDPSQDGEQAPQLVLREQPTE
ncbi:MAG: hypothetical protein WD232_10170 [Acidimicrobiales bacterium]